MYSLRTMLGKAVDDVLCLCEYDNNHFFVGTTAGLVSVAINGRNIVLHTLVANKDWLMRWYTALVKDECWNIMDRYKLKE